MDLIINLKEYPGLKEKDIVEIYHPENDYPRLLLQVTSVDAPGRTKGKQTFFMSKKYMYTIGNIEVISYNCVLQMTK